MQTETVDNCSGVREGRKPPRPDAPSDSRRLAPLPEVRRKILAGLARRLEQESLSDCKRNRNNSCKPNFPDSTVIIEPFRLTKTDMNTKKKSPVKYKSLAKAVSESNRTIRSGNSPKPARTTRKALYLGTLTPDPETPVPTPTPPPD